MSLDYEDFQQQTITPPGYCSHGLIERLYARGLHDFEHTRTLCIMCGAVLYRRKTDWKALGLESRDGTEADVGTREGRKTD